MKFQSKEINVSNLEINKGQLYGLPKNPRFIKDERYKALLKSIEDAPEMLGLREILVYPLEGTDHFIIIGGNMRFRACQELKYKSVPCKIIPLETPVQKLREYTIKDNEGFGQNDWDILANEWDLEEMTDWGVDVSFLSVDDADSTDIDALFADAENTEEKVKDFKIEVVVDHDQEEMLEAIKESIKAALTEYEGVTLK